MHEDIPSRDSLPQIVELHGNRWMKRQDLQNQMGISRRTFYRRIDEGKVERLETPSGPLFRVAQHGTGGTGDKPPVPVVGKAEHIGADTVPKTPMAQVAQRGTHGTSNTKPVPMVGSIAPIEVEAVPWEADGTHGTGGTVGVPRCAMGVFGTGDGTSGTTSVPAVAQHTPVGVVSLLVDRLTDSGHARCRLEVELEQVKADRAKLWEIVGELTGEMIELERRLAISEGGTC